MVVQDELPGPSRSRAPSAHTATELSTEVAVDHSAGPSRRRFSRGADTDDGDQDHPMNGTGVPRRTASPESTLSRHPASPRPSTEHAPHLDLATYPTPTLLRLLASLLQQIASANDHLRPEHDDEIATGSANGGTGGGGDTLHDDSASTTGSTQSTSRSSTAHHPSPTTALFAGDEQPRPFHEFDSSTDKLFSAAQISLSHPSSILSFHARHVPSISIEAYLLRILKYCPTTNEVFLGLLVYFDRMSKLGTPAGVGGTSAAVGPRGFAIDSYNVHRLVIAGVTVASKFFSDVFYTNSRYAKVGGLPAHELNQLELQFLLLNNFTLMIPPDEMQRYGDRLLSYWLSHEQDATGDLNVTPSEEISATDTATAATATSAAPTSTGRGKSPAETRMDVDDTAEKGASGSTPAAVVATPTPGPPSREASHTPVSRRPAAPTTTVSVSSDTNPIMTSSPVAPRGRERSSNSSSGRSGVSFAPTPERAPVAATATTLTSGLREWVRNDEAIGVVSTPLRD